MDETDRLKEELYQRLDDYIENSLLVDLHTHLIGMGNADFWVGKIMYTFIYRISCMKPNDIQKIGAVKCVENAFKHIQESVHPDTELVHRYESKRKPLKTVLGMLKRIKNEFLSSKGSFNWCEIHKKYGSTGIFDKYFIPSTDIDYEFTDDVVYTAEHLLVALNGVNRGLEGEDGARKLRNHLTFGNNDCRRLYDRVYKDYVVFDARNNCFKLKEGLPNNYFVECRNILEKTQNPYENVQNLQKKLRKYFSYDENADQMQKDADKEQFDPDFYPLRFALKDDIYEQYPEVLSILLNHVAHQYSLSGVNNVEFSFSLSDLLNLNIWKHLVNAWPQDSQDPLYKEKKKRKHEENVKYETKIRIKRQKMTPRGRGTKYSRAVPATPISSSSSRNQTSSDRSRSIYSSESMDVDEEVNSNAIPFDDGSAGVKMEEIEEKYVAEDENAMEAFYSERKLSKRLHTDDGIPAGLDDQDTGELTPKWRKYLGGTYKRKPEGFNFTFLMAFARNAAKIDELKEYGNNSRKFLAKSPKVAETLCSTDAKIEKVFPKFFRGAGTAPVDRLLRILQRPQNLSREEEHVGKQILGRVVGFDLWETRKVIRGPRFGTRNSKKSLKYSGQHDTRNSLGSDSMRVRSITRELERDQRAPKP